MEIKKSKEKKIADIRFRNYTNMWGITEDYYKVRNFFIELTLSI